MFRNDVDLQIAGTTDVSDDAFFYAYHVFWMNYDALCYRKEL